MIRSFTFYVEKCEKKISYQDTISGAPNLQGAT